MASQPPAPNIPITNANVLSGGNSFTQPWWMFMLTLFNRTGGSQGGAVIVPGSIMDWAGTIVPEGYLACDGSAISRINYPQLFSVLGTTWGPGDGSTTFNLPDFRGRVLIGANGSYPVGGTGGSPTVTLSVANLPAHNHAVTDPGHTHTITDPGHSHTVPASSSAGSAGALTGTALAGSTGTATTGITVNSATTGITTQNTGSGTAVNILPPYAVVMRIIKI